MKIPKMTKEINSEGIIEEEFDLNDPKASFSQSSLLNRLIMPLILVFLILGAYGVGYLTFLDTNRPAISLSSSNLSVWEGSGTKFDNSNQIIVASKHGSKYYFTHCGSSKRIKEENRIFFESESEAKLAGYTLALNCRPSL